MNPSNEKLCTKCNLVKKITDFGKRTSTKDKLQCFCRQCSYILIQQWKIDNKDRKKNTDTKWRELNRERLQNRNRYKEVDKNSYLKREYGITLEDYNKILLEQNNVCAICKCSIETNKKALCVDHDHETNKVRGLLCHACNKALGLFRDNIEILILATSYLKRYKKWL